MNIWLGFTDQVATLQNFPGVHVRVSIKNIDILIQEHSINDSIVHSVGRWWNSNDGIELRNQLKDAGFKFQHHLILNK